MAIRRTTMYSNAGKKLYAVRAADGTFKDIQTYERAHRADMAHKSAAEEDRRPQEGREEEVACQEGRQESRQEGDEESRRAKKTASRRRPA